MEFKLACGCLVGVCVFTSKQLKKNIKTWVSTKDHLFIFFYIVITVREQSLSGPELRVSGVVFFSLTLCYILEQERKERNACLFIELKQRYLPCF